MRLNMIQPQSGAKTKQKRPGRGIGSGLGKTGGRGQKGQKSRSGGNLKVGFEGGQMPLKRRLPKVGFHSRLAQTTDEVRLHELTNLDADVVDLTLLKKAKVISRNIKRVKIISQGKLEKAIKIKGLAVTKGAREAIEAAGGKIIEE
jgi:large subunit ribosomal protein L15